MRVEEKRRKESIESSPVQTSFEVSSMEALTPEADSDVNDLSKIPDGKYKEILQRFPEVLKLNFGLKVTIR